MSKKNKSKTALAEKLAKEGAGKTLKMKDAQVSAGESQPMESSDEPKKERVSRLSPEEIAAHKVARARKFMILEHFLPMVKADKRIGEGSGSVLASMSENELGEVIYKVVDREMTGDYRKVLAALRKDYAVPVTVSEDK